MEVVTLGFAAAPLGLEVGVFVDLASAGKHDHPRFFVNKVTHCPLALVVEGHSKAGKAPPPPPTPGVLKPRLTLGAALPLWLRPHHRSWTLAHTSMRLSATTS